MCQDGECDTCRRACTCCNLLVKLQGMQMDAEELTNSFTVLDNTDKQVVCL